MSWKLYFMIGFMALLFAIELCALWFSITMEGVVLKLVVALFLTIVSTALLTVFVVNRSLQLEDSIAVLNSTQKKLIQERARAESAEKTKKRFLVNMSHEIRTPMNGILGFASYLKASVSNREHQESIHMIIKSADHLMAILNDIIDFSGLKTDEIEFVRHPFNLKDAVKDVYTFMESSIKVKNISLDYRIGGGIPEMITGDVVRLNQILINLVSNAVKFTDPGGAVMISVNYVEEVDEALILEFSIKDTGVGIPLDKQDQIFELFEQATSHSSRKFGGMGLGLAIVKRLVELQQGKIYVDSIPGVGSDFYFRLPFSKVSNKGDLEKLKGLNLEEKDVELGKGIRVLIVEDNPINQLLVIKLLQKHGYETTVAPNGRVGLEKHQKDDFDIILMDLQMPEMDGYEATICIRKLDMGGKRDIPIVAMTAHTIKGEFEKCLAMGMDDYISKPFRPQELYDKIQLLVKNRKHAKLFKA